MSVIKKTLGELCIIEKGKIGIQKAIPGEFPLVVTAEERLSHNECHFEGNAVIIPLVSSTGHGHKSLKRIHFQSGKFAVGNILCVVMPRDEAVLNAEYLYRFLDLNREKELVGRMKGMANVTLPLKEIALIEIPLPPVAEQLKFVEAYKQLETSKNKLDSELTHQLTLVKQLRQSFLREAMQGKLTADFRSAHPELIEGENSAQALLEKIKAKKEKSFPLRGNKKGASLAPIGEDEIPFKIPDGWVWCRLGEICSKITDGFHNTPLKVSIGFPYIAATQVKSDKIDWENCDFVDEKYHRELYLKTYPQKGELLVVNIGAGCGTPAIIDVDFEFSFKNTAILKFNQSLISNKLLFFYFLLRKEDIYTELTKGGLQPFLSLKILNDINIPLPPLSEQQAIVSKLDKLMRTCDELEASIRASQQHNEMLLQQVLREALEEKKTEPVLQTVSATRKSNISERTILAAYLIRWFNSAGFGRVMLMKLLFLVEYICQINFESKYVVNVAGPYDDLILEIESKLRRYGIYDARKNKIDNHVHYLEMTGVATVEELFEEKFSGEREQIESIIHTFKKAKWEQCEIVATLYAVWNNRIIKGQIINDLALKQDFLNWDPRKQKYTDRLDSALDWMRGNNIIPAGWGSVIEK